MGIIWLSMTAQSTASDAKRNRHFCFYQRDPRQQQSTLLDALPIRRLTVKMLLVSSVFIRTMTSWIYQAVSVKSVEESVAAVDCKPQHVHSISCRPEGCSLGINLAGFSAGFVFARRILTLVLQRLFTLSIESESSQNLQILLRKYLKKGEKKKSIFRIWSLGQSDELFICKMIIM